MRHHWAMVHSTPKLGPAELKVLTLITEGLTSRQIAQRLGRSISTIKNQTHRIFQRYGVPNRVALKAVVAPGPIVVTSGRRAPKESTPRQVRVIRQTLLTVGDIFEVGGEQFRVDFMPNDRSVLLATRC